MWLLMMALMADPGAAAVAPRVALETSAGQIVIELDAAKAPQTVENFLTYVRDGFYDGTVFHRVIPDFMIQGGGFTAEMQQKQVRSPIQNEARNGLRNTRGSVAMARTNNPHSATAQFFVNLVDNVALDQASARPGDFGYAVFGHVVSGMDVVDKIALVRTGNRGPHRDVPVEPVVIRSAKVVEPPKAGGA
jgi:cyclophilin family peptidyl-prolyl cis-trans isomerase